MTKRRLGGPMFRIAITMILAGVVSSVALLTPGAPAAQAAKTEHYASADFDASKFANVTLPEDLGQTGIQAYVSASQHSVRGYLLDYWRANGGPSVYGNPITEPFASQNGFYSQAFAGGVMQYIPDLVWTDAASVTLMPIAKTVLDDQVGTFTRSGRRGGGGGDRNKIAFTAVPAGSKTAQNTINNGGSYIDASAHTLSGAIADWYNTHEGASYLGNPVTEPVTERGVTIQYFDGAAVMQNSGGEVYLAPVVQEHAASLKLDTTPVAQGNMPAYSEELFWTEDNPYPQGDPNSAGRKLIEVNTTTETMNVYQGSTLVLTSLVSTGLAPNFTAAGTFHVRYKLPKTDMAGTISADGKVDALGQAASDQAKAGDLPGQTGWIVPDVPDVMYFNSEAEALHGAYWHNNFGNPMSHGCVNLPLDVAHFMFGWAPVGTEVWIHA
jgi:lipoprotein-anchoring transpeptidase ErfK/SrfK